MVTVTLNARALRRHRRHRELLGAQRHRSGHHRAERRVHAAQGEAHLDDRHAQRVPRPEEPVHPRQLRQLRVLEPRQLRGRARAALRPQLLGDERPAPARGVQGPAVGLLRRRHVARAAGPDAHLRRARRRADLSRRSRTPTRSRWRTSASRPTSSRTRCSSRRARASTGTSAATARSRSAAARGCSPAGRPTSGSRTSSATPASTSRASGPRNNATNLIPFVADPLKQPTTITGATAGGVLERDRHDRSRLQVPVGPARQRRLRP